MEQTSPACTFKKDQFSDLTNIQDSHELRQSVVEIGNWRSLCENLKINNDCQFTILLSCQQLIQFFPHREKDNGTDFPCLHI